jgi:hypothetical protein
VCINAHLFYLTCINAYILHNITVPTGISSLVAAKVQDEIRILKIGREVYQLVYDSICQNQFVWAWDWGSDSHAMNTLAMVHMRHRPVTGLRNDEVPQRDAGGQLDPIMSPWQ